MGIFISWEKTVECICIAVLFSLALVLAAHKLLGILQSCGYSGKDFLKWTNKKDNMIMERLGLLTLCCLLTCAVISLCFYFAGKWAAIIGLTAYIIFFALYAYADSKVALKTSAVRTPRFMRLVCVLWLVAAIVTYVIVTLLNFAAYMWNYPLFDALKYCVLALIPLIIIPLMCLANLITKIYEVPHSKGFIKKAKAKLASSGIKVVGVTGSYGKTSVKNILAAMLSKNYKVLATPASFNTPLGIAKTINDNNLQSYDIFIAEMGARHAGDIAKLCTICPPDYSCITGVCPQHLETFKSIENIINTKGEIIPATKETCVIAADCLESFKGFGGAILPGDCVSDIVCGCDCTHFTLKLNGKTRRLRTCLLGEHSAYNIGLAATVAFLLGVSFEDIVSAAEGLGFVEHRLQLIERNGIHILDDGYNSNVVGASEAIAALKRFDGRKIVVTPGIVELGVLSEEENGALGARFVGLDYVILVGETLALPVKEGYLAAGGDKDKLAIVPSLEAAQDKLKKLLSEGDAVLFLNDLPDRY